MPVTWHMVGVAPLSDPQQFSSPDPVFVGMPMRSVHWVAEAGILDKSQVSRAITRRYYFTPLTGLSRGTCWRRAPDPYEA